MHVSTKTPDKRQISVICCENERDLRRYPIDSIAQDIIGSDVPRTFPVYLFFYDGVLRGWANVRQQLIVYPCIHPDKIPPREFFKLTRSLVTEFKRYAGDPIFLLCDYARKLGEKHMRQLRLKKMAEEAYQYCEEDE